MKWAKIIFVADFSVSKGVQFDRTCQVSIGHVNVYYGTTAEPGQDIGRQWRAERDITDCTALLRTPHAGMVNLGNIVNSTYTGVIRGSAYLLFYPPDKANPAPNTPDLVLPIPNSPNGAQGLASSSDLLTETFTLPTNIIRAYLDIITQSQIGDEFWYLHVPTPLARQLNASGGTAFREAEIRIDGRPAGVAPVYPWIYTGGIDPALWCPIPGVQTLNFVPCRVDLTPFAALLSNGKPHTLSVQLYNSDNYFLVLGTLLLYRDSSRAVVTGQLFTDTLSAAPTPHVWDKLVTASPGDATGPISITSHRKFIIGGCVNTSHGQVTTIIRQNIAFMNRQDYALSASQDRQDLQQKTQVISDTKISCDGQVTEHQKSLRYSLTLDSDSVDHSKKTVLQSVQVSQGYQVKQVFLEDRRKPFTSSVSDTVQSADTLQFDSHAKLTRETGQKSTSVYRDTNSTGAFYQRSLSSARGRLTSVTTQHHTGRK